MAHQGLRCILTVTHVQLLTSPHTKRKLQQNAFRHSIKKTKTHLEFKRTSKVRVWVKVMSSTQACISFQLTVNHLISNRRLKLQDAETQQASMAQIQIKGYTFSSLSSPGFCVFVFFICRFTVANSSRVVTQVMPFSMRYKQINHSSTDYSKTDLAHSSNICLGRDS